VNLAHQVFDEMPERRNVGFMVMRWWLWWWSKEVVMVVVMTRWSKGSDRREMRS